MPRTRGGVVHHLFVDGESMAIARYPNQGWLRTDTGNNTAGQASFASRPAAMSGISARLHQHSRLGTFGRGF